MNISIYKHSANLSTLILLTMLINANCSLKYPNASRSKRFALDDVLRVQQQQKTPPKPYNDQRFKDRLSDDKIIFDRGSLPTPSPTATSTERLIDASRTDKNDQEYFSKANGEYKFSLSLRNGVKHAESGEFEERNGQRLFVIRGFFQHIVNDSTLKITAYIFDDNGYHEIPFPHDGADGDTGIVDFRPIDTETMCDLSKGEYCIDRKLLNLMVG